MYTVVFGLGDAKLSTIAPGVLRSLADPGSFVATIETRFSMAALASVMNNMSATLVAAPVIDRADMASLRRC